MMTQILSIGHSTLSYEDFLARLREGDVTAIADVRSSPYSKNFPQYNRETLKKRLIADGIAYVFLGDELGGRPRDRSYYTEGVADYEKMALADSFSHGLKRIERGAKNYRIAMMCSERNPLDCHRCLLVGRALAKRGSVVRHLLHNGRVETQGEIERQLLSMAGEQSAHMFASEDELLNDAYRDRAQKVAFSEGAASSHIVAAG